MYASVKKKAQLYTQTPYTPTHTRIQPHTIAHAHTHTRTHIHNEQDRNPIVKCLVKSMCGQLAWRCPRSLKGLPGKISGLVPIMYFKAIKYYRISD